MWNNFHGLAAKIGKPPPPHPLFFIKSATSVIGPHAPIRRPAGYGGKIIFEGELGIVVGRCAKEVPVRFKAHIESKVRKFVSYNVLGLLPGRLSGGQAVAYSAHYATTSASIQR